jgi:hypothetical protein
VIHGASLRVHACMNRNPPQRVKFNLSYKENLQWHRNATNVQARGSVQRAEVRAKLRVRDSGPLIRVSAIVPFVEANGYAGFAEVLELFDSAGLGG